MPHQTHERKFGRTTDQRLAMLRNLTVSVLRYEKVRTTEARGKEIRRFVDRMILLGKDGSLSARRQAIAWLPEPELVDKVFTDLNERFPDRRSGFLRMTRIGHRVGDAAPMVQLELMPSAADERKTKETAEAEAKPRRRLGLPRRRSAEKKTAAAGSAKE
ncbi:MAG: 50S ribosomal protein L17 [Chloroflexota bacterium]|nr:50S ribosomal protein L17 [Chloroflexota bacterium]MDE3193326.1 50S ribosomal protein L17 [Chloroflexota bacterium]